MKRVIQAVIVCCMLFSLVTIILVPPAGGAAGEEKETMFHCWKCKETFEALASVKEGKCPYCGAKYALKVPPPTPRAEPAVISWEDGADYIGQNKTVEGVIVGSHLSNRSGNLYLNFSKDYWAGLSVQIPASKLKKFRGDAASFYQGKKINARGLIQKEKKYLRCVVTSPDDLKVIE
jgi:DNA-directed RNA polymerase subunit RPC12/RpoP